MLQVADGRSEAFQALQRLFAALRVAGAQRRSQQLLEALLGPSLRSRNPERRKEAPQSLESLAATVSHLKHLLLVRDLRRLAGD